MQDENLPHGESVRKGFGDRREAERAKRASTSYSLRHAYEKRVISSELVVRRLNYFLKF
jgi:hypothetical protein